MKWWIKLLLGISGGFGAGFAAGFLFHKKLNDVQIEEVTEEEMALLEAQATKEQKLEPKSEAVLSSKAEVESLQDLPEDPDKMRINLQGKVSYIQADQEAKEKYANIWTAIKKYSDEENADDLPVPKHEEEEDDDLSDNVEEGFDEEFLEVIEKEQVEPGQIDPPHPISLSEFYNERSEYDKITIDWYEPFTFVDEREEIIADLTSYVGDIDIRKLFGSNGPNEDPDIRFVRNEQYGTDYEIIKHHRTWQETTGEE